MQDLRAYHYAFSPAEAVALLRRGPGKGVYIGGGTDLYLAFPAGVNFVVDINGAGLGEIARTDTDELAIGAAATLQQVVNSPLCQRYAGGAIAEAAARCGNRAVRSVATIGGNLCTALPSADMAPILLVLDAELEHTDGSDWRRIPLTDFFLGPRRTVLGDRLLTRIVLPARCGGWHARSCKLGRTSEDIALVHVAIGLELDGPLIKDARIALGAVAPRPCRVVHAEETLRGLKTTVRTARTAIAAAAQLAVMRAEPIDDQRASAAYRRAMVGVLSQRLVSELCGLPPEGTSPDPTTVSRATDRLSRELQTPDYGAQGAESSEGAGAARHSDSDGESVEASPGAERPRSERGNEADTTSPAPSAPPQDPSPSPPSPGSSGGAHHRRGRGGRGGRGRPRGERG